KPAAEVAALEPIVRHPVVNDCGRFIHTAVSRVPHPQEELVILARAERTFELPQVGTKSSHGANNRGAHRHVRADWNEIVARAGRSAALIACDLPGVATIR